MAQKIVEKINWENTPSIRTPINEDNLNQMDSELDELDDRVVNLMGYEERVSESEVNAKRSEDLAKSWAVGGTGEREGEDTNSSKSWANKAKDYANAASNSAIASETARDLAQKYRDEAFSATPENYEATLHNAESAYKALFETSSQTISLPIEYSGSYYCKYASINKKEGMFKIGCSTRVTAFGGGESNVNVTVKNGSDEVVFNKDYEFVGNYIDLSFDIYTTVEAETYSFAITANGTAPYFTFNRINVSLESISRNNLDLKDYLIAEGVTELLPETENPLPTFSGKTFMINHELIEKNKKYYCGFSWELIKNDGTLPVISATIGIYYKDALKNEIQKYFGSTKNGIALFDFSVEDKDINYILLIITGAGSYKISDLFVNDYGKYNTQIVGEKKIIERINTIDEKQDLQNVRLSSGTELSLETAKSRIRLQEIEGGMYKSANLWDEKWEIGSITAGDGSNYGSTSQIRSSNYIKVKPNTSYYFVVGGGQLTGKFYDANKVAIGTSWGLNASIDRSITTPSNAEYFRFCMQPSYGTTYLHNIAIIEGTSGTYEPYELNISGDMGFFDGELVQGGTNADGTYSTSTQRVRTVTLVPMKIGDVIVTSGSQQVNIDEYTKDKVYSKSSGWVNNTYTATQDGYFIVTFRNGSDAISPQTIGKVTVTINGQYAEVVKQKQVILQDVEVGNLDHTASKIDSTTRLRTKNPITVKGGDVFEYVCTNNIGIAFYFVGASGVVNTPAFIYENGSVIAPSNATSLMCTYRAKTDRTMNVSDVENIALYRRGNTTMIPLSQPLAEGDKIDENGEYHEKKIIDLLALPFSHLSGNATYGDAYMINLSTQASTPIDTSDLMNIFADNYKTVAVSDIKTTDKSIALRSDNVLFVQDSDGKPSGRAIVKLATPTLTPLTNEQKIALNSLESYEGQTYISTSDGLAKLKVEYASSKVVAITMANEYAIKELSEEVIPEIKSDIEEIIDTQNVHFSTGTEITVDTKKGGMRFVGAKGGMRRSPNLLDVNNLTNENAYLGSGGSENENTGNAISSYIEIKPNTSYMMQNVQGNSAGYAWYDSNKTLISFTPYSVDPTGNKVVSSPSNAKYVRMTILKSNKNIIMLNEGTEPLPYETYGLRVAGDMGLVNLADLSYTWSGSWSCWRAVLDGAKYPSNNNTLANIISDYPNSTVNTLVANSAIGMALAQDGAFLVRNGSNTEKPSGYLAYEVADGATPSQYCEVIKEHGKNLLDYPNGFTKISSSSIRRKAYKLKPNTKYTISQIIDRTGNTAWIYAVSGNDINASFSTSANGCLVGSSRTVQTDSEGYITIGLYDDSANDVYSNGIAQFEEGESATEILPYQTNTTIIPLSQSLAEGDKIIYKDGKWYEYHRFWSDVITVDEEWQSKTSDNSWMYNCHITKKPKTNGDLGIHQIYIGGGIISNNYALNNGTYDTMQSEMYQPYVKNNGDGVIIITTPNAIDTLAKAKDYFGTAKVVYELATPIYNEITDQSTLYQLESYEGQTHISTADNLATLTVAYGKSDTVATALLADNQSKVNEARIEENKQYSVEERFSGLKIIKDGKRITLTTSSDILYSSIKTLTLSDKPITYFRGVAWVMSGSNRYVGIVTVAPSGAIEVMYTSSFGGSKTVPSDSATVHLDVTYYTE